jgi:uncharacterized protein involved in exopolysaccharide biosynthesis
MSNQINLQNSNSDSDEISLKELIINTKEWIIYLISKWKLIILTSFVCSSFGLIYAINEKPTYKATLTFALEEDKGGGAGLSGALGFASSLGIDLGGSGGGAFAGTNLTELMKSRLVIEKTLLSPVVIEEDTISLAEYYIRLNKLRDNWSSNPKLSKVQFPYNADRSSFTLQQDSILNTFYRSLTTKEKLLISQKDKKVSITNIDVISESEHFAKLFCEKLAKETSDFYIETKSKKARINAEILQKQADSVRTQLNAAINGVAAEVDNVYNLNPALNIRTAPSKKRQVDVQANTAILTQLVTQSELSKITLRKETPLIQIIDKPILPLEKIKSGKLKSLILGGILGCFISLGFLIIQRAYLKIIS